MPIALAVHGGAGRQTSDDPADRERREHLRRALRAGHTLLARGAPALDACVAAVEVLEDSGLFDAGRGSVRDASGQVTCDAAVMDGAGRAVGACALVRGVRHPVALAHAVLARTRHALLVGPPAEAHARAWGLEEVAADWYLEPTGPAPVGTVGAVACDAAGRLAAATSTGGTSGKLPGRVGDSPLAGAGTWADARLAVSATGVGEAFIRTAFARRAADLVELAGLDPGAACRRALAEVEAVGGWGGCIAVDAGGGIHLVPGSPSLHRGAIAADGVPLVAVLADERPA